MAYVLFILVNNVIPIFSVILVGYVLGKRFDLDMFSLSKLAIYVFVPIFIFVNLYTIDIPTNMGNVVAFTLILLVANHLLGSLIGRLRGYDRPTLTAYRNAIMFYNSGNIGIPLITLIYRETPYLGLALAVQIVVLVIQNVVVYSVGFFTAGRANMAWQKALSAVFKVPTIYTIPLAILFRWLPVDLTVTPLWPALSYVRDGMIPVAMLTLGIQLSKTRYNARNAEVFFASFSRLLGGPAMAAMLSWVLGLPDVIAQVLVISSAVPTAVNTVLIAVEHNNRPDFASQTVMVSTTLSAFTLSLVIYVARVVFPVGT